MTSERDGAPARVGQHRPNEVVDRPPRPGQPAVVAAALAIGIVLMGIQLWLLTVALDLYLAGGGSGIWTLVIVSGAIFAGGFAILWLLQRRPRIRRSGAANTER